MIVNTGKMVRLHDLINPRTDNCLLVDTSVTSGVGAVEGLEHFHDTVTGINEICDGIIVNPGQLEHHAELFGGSRRATPLVRLDWTNYFRKADFCLPAKTVYRIMISDVEDALQLGASAGVVRYMMGFDDDFEARNIESISHVAKKAYREAFPILVEIGPFGYKVSQHNLEDTIKLGVACMLEIGIDGIIIPDCPIEIMRIIGEWTDIPVIIRISEQFQPKNLDIMLNTGLSGMLIGENIYNTLDYKKFIKALFVQMHQEKA